MIWFKVSWGFILNDKEISIADVCNSLKNSINKGNKYNILTDLPPLTHFEWFLRISCCNYTLTCFSPTSFTISPSYPRILFVCIYISYTCYAYTCYVIQRLFPSWVCGNNSLLACRKGHFLPSIILQITKFLASGPKILHPRKDTIFI